MGCCWDESSVTGVRKGVTGMGMGVTGVGRGVTVVGRGIAGKERYLILCSGMG